MSISTLMGSGLRRSGLIAGVVVLLAGCQGYRDGSPRTFGEITDDTAIQSKLKLSLIGDKEIGGLRINTEVHKGVVTLIHRADRLDDIIRGLGGKFGGITVCPLWPRAGVPAKRLIIRARKGLATPFTLTAGLVLHADSGDYTAEAGAVLRGGPLEF